jgi:hypothetical protein
LEHRLNWPDQVALELRPSSLTVFDFASRELEVFFTPDMYWFADDPRAGPITFAVFLGAFTATMVHGAGLIRNGVTALFLAPDGGGKTTAVGLSTAGTILCDDQIVIRKESNSLMAYGTPWGLTTNSSQTARVGGIFLLEKAEQFELIPLEPERALEYSWNEHLAYRVPLPKRLRSQAFDILYDICYQAPCYRMRFPKDYVDWDAIDAAMR